MIPLFVRVEISLLLSAHVSYEERFMEDASARFDARCPLEYNFSNQVVPKVPPAGTWPYYSNNVIFRRTNLHSAAQWFPEVLFSCPVPPPRHRLINTSWVSSPQDESSIHPCKFPDFSISGRSYSPDCLFSLRRFFFPLLVGPRQPPPVES